MPIGIVSDIDFEREVGIIPKIPEIKELPTKGRNEGDNNVPDSLRKIIGETSIVDSPSDAIELANKFGISKSSVSAYANGSTSTNSYDKQPNLDHLNRIREQISRKARKTLIRAIDQITDDKLVNAKADTLANVARGMSAIVKEMEPETPKSISDKTPVQFIFYSPQFHKEEKYEHIFVQDNK
jgi:transcriptional regulator with XRE-family HTH domain